MKAVFSRTRIKFCGLTRVQDIHLAGELGVDAIGLVFAHGSKRHITLEQALVLRQAVAPLLNIVALFRNNPSAEIANIARALQPHYLQFHGEEDEQFCAQFDRPYLKAVAMGGCDAANMPDLQQIYPTAAALLLDSHAPGQSGGSGTLFDWSHIPAYLQRPFLLAGGIHPDNVFTAISTVRPWGVDVSSGIESAPGVKNAQRMRQFVSEVKRADNVLTSCFAALPQH